MSDDDVQMDDSPLIYGGNKTYIVLFLKSALIHTNLYYF